MRFCGYRLALADMTIDPPVSGVEPGRGRQFHQYLAMASDHASTIWPQRAICQSHTCNNWAYLLVQHKQYAF